MTERPSTGDPAPETPVGPSVGHAPEAVRLAPVETDTTRILQVGTVVWAVAFVVLLVVRFAAPDWSADHDQWLWIALTGAVLGGIGLVIVGRHRRLGRTR